MTRKHSATSLTSNSCCDSLTAGLSAAAAGASVAVAATSGKAVAFCERTAPVEASPAFLDSVSWPGADGVTSSFEVGTDGSFSSEAGDFLFEKPRCQNARLTEPVEGCREPRGSSESASPGSEAVSSDSLSVAEADPFFFRKPAASRRLCRRRCRSPCFRKTAPAKRCDSSGIATTILATLTLTWFFDRGSGSSATVSESMTAIRYEPARCESVSLGSQMQVHEAGSQATTHAQSPRGFLPSNAPRDRPGGQVLAMILFQVRSCPSAA